MKKLFTLILISFLYLNPSYSEEITLKCLFVMGERTSPNEVREWGLGDQPDEYLKLDFEKEKIKDAPYYENFFVSNPLFWENKVTWHRTKKNSYGFFAELNRETGVLNIIWNKLPSDSKRYSTEHIYQCEKAKMKF